MVVQLPKPSSRRKPVYIGMRLIPFVLIIINWIEFFFEAFFLGCPKGKVFWRCIGIFHRLTHPLFSKPPSCAKNAVKDKLRCCVFTHSAMQLDVLGISLQNMPGCKQTHRENLPLLTIWGARGFSSMNPPRGWCHEPQAYSFDCTCCQSTAGF